MSDTAVLCRLNVVGENSCYQILHIHIARSYYARQFVAVVVELVRNKVLQARTLKRS